MSNRVVKKVVGGDQDLKLTPDSEDEIPVSFGAAGGRPVRNAYELVRKRKQFVKFKISLDVKLFVI